MTEDKAKTMQCCGPPAVMEAAIAAHATRLSEAAAAKVGLCWGSKCMAWRWDRQRTAADIDGYCGLAGTPR